MKKVKKSPQKNKSRKKEVKPKISYSLWFTEQIRKGVFEPYQKREILVFIKNKGLSTFEESDKFDKCMEKY